MKLLVGLGNPGPKYAGHRHNVGFMAVDAIARAHGFGPWRSKFQGQIAEGRLGDAKIWLLKPETFMNLSGQSVAAAARFYKLEPADIAVFHDELDLAPGKLRVKTGGGMAGHNGLKSMKQHLGPDFTRIRIGIGHPGAKERVNAHVLGDFAKADAAWRDPLLEAIAAAAPHLAADAPDKFMSHVAQPQATAQPQTSNPPVKPGTAAPAPAKDCRSPLQKLIDKFS
ncbi:MAG: aminoacyl-tRNA hydrolase [Pseudomonadota bacterium]